MDRLKAFLVGTLKIALALFLAVIAIVGAIAGWNAYDDSRRKAQEASLAQPKQWPPIKVEPLVGVELKLMTIWRDHQLHYQFFVDGYPKAIENAREPARQRHFTIQFLDSNGFKILSHEVLLNSMTKIVDAKGQGLALQANSSTSMSADQYRNAARWEITWNFPSAVAAPKPEVSAKPKAAAPRWRDLSLWRQLNRQMSKAQVEQLLGPPTKIDEGGALTFWHYGYPSGGKVMFSRNGAIYGWDEPSRH